MYDPATTHVVTDGHATESRYTVGSDPALAGNGTCCVAHEDPDPISRSFVTYSVATHCDAAGHATSLTDVSGAPKGLHDDPDPVSSSPPFGPDVAA